MRKIKLIASDLDGTLLLNGAQKLQSQTCEIIERLMERGIIFIAASGRQYPNLLNLFAHIKDKIGYICENGCMSYLNGKMISQETMDRKLGDEIIQAITEREGCEVMISGKKTAYIHSKNADFIKYMQEVVHYYITPIDDIFSVPEEYMKISVYEEAGINSANYWINNFGERCTVQVSDTIWLDMVPKNVNKSTAFAKILQHLNIDAQDCIMFGDNYNDLEILSMVGCPIVMNSANADIRAHGKYTVDTVENALLRILDGDGFE